MPGGPGGGGRASKPPADTTKLYKALGVEKTASAEDIRKAYMSIVRTTHPDRGGDPEKFKVVQKAYEASWHTVMMSLDMRRANAA